jgi:hypothetical protein
MAIKPIKRAAATTVIDLTTGLTRKRALTAKQFQPQPVSRIDIKDVVEPAHLVRVLNEIQATVTTASNASRTDPGAQGAAYFRNVAVVSGITKTLPHNLQRPYVGYLVTRVQGANQITVREVAVPAGMTVAQVVSLVPSATGTIDVKVF